MWSIGCILGELLGGQPMFPGKSTMNQLEKIIEITGRPSKADMAAIRSKYTSTMLDSLNIKPQKPLSAMFPNASAEALDLLRQLLQFNPEKRIDAATSLKHPYLAQFHNPDDEPVLAKPLTISMDDNKRSTISAYRKYLYKRIVQRKKELRAKHKGKGGSSKNGSKKGSGGTDSTDSTPPGSAPQTPNVQSQEANKALNGTPGGELKDKDSQSTRQPSGSASKSEKDKSHRIRHHSSNSGGLSSQNNASDTSVSNNANSGSGNANSSSGSTSNGQLSGLKKL
jgi:mitogen-activated protein kinase 15